MTRPRLLDLFCGAGGAAMGYWRAGFEVVGVDIAPQPHYPFEFHQGDAMDVLRRLIAGETWQGYVLADFAVIHASPPCGAYGSLENLNAARGNPSKHERLIEPVRNLLDVAGLPYVIENVQIAPLRTATILCGSMFGLRVRRHRAFESNIALMRQHCRHRGHDFVGVYGDHPETGTIGYDGYTRKPRASTIDEAQQAMGMPWGDWQAVRLAIPPAYTEYIGAQLMQHLGRTPHAVATCPEPS